MAKGHIDQAVDCLLDAVGELHEIPIPSIHTSLDNATARILEASSDGLTKYVEMLAKLKTDVEDLQKGILRAANEIEEFAVRIDNMK